MSEDKRKARAASSVQPDTDPTQEALNGSADAGPSFFGVTQGMLDELPDFTKPEEEPPIAAPDMGTQTFLPSWATSIDSPKKYGTKLTGEHSAAYGRYEQLRTDSSFWKPGAMTMEIAVFQGDLSDCTGHDDQRWSVIYYQNNEMPPGEALLRMLRDEFGGGAFRLRFIDNTAKTARSKLKDALTIEVDSFMTRADKNVALGLLEHQRLERQEQREEKMAADRMAFHMQQQMINSMQQQLSQKEKAVEEARLNASARQEESMALKILTQQMEERKEEAKSAKQEANNNQNFLLQWMTMNQDREEKRKLEEERMRREDEARRREEQQRQWQFFQQQQQMQQQYWKDDDDDGGKQSELMLAMMQMNQQSNQLMMQMQQQSRSDTFKLISTVLPLVVPMLTKKEEDSEEKFARMATLMKTLMPSENRNDPLIALLQSQSAADRQRADNFQKELIREMRESKKNDGPLGGLSQVKEVANVFNEVRRAFGDPAQEEKKDEPTGVAAIAANLLNGPNVGTLVQAVAQRISTPASPAGQGGGRNLRQSRVGPPAPPPLTPQQQQIQQQMMIQQQQQIQQQRAMMAQQQQQIPQPQPQQPPPGAQPQPQQPPPGAQPQPQAPPQPQGEPQLEQKYEGEWAGQKELREEQKKREEKLQARAQLDPQINQLLDAIEQAIVSESPEDFVKRLTPEQKLGIRVNMPTQEGAVKFIRDSAGTDNIESSRGLRWLKKACHRLYTEA